MIKKALHSIFSLLGMTIAEQHDSWFNIKMCFERIVGNKYMLVLYILATLYILIKEKDWNKKCLMVIYPILLSTVVFCPFFYFIVKGVLRDTYFRIFWLFPAGIVIAYAGVDLVYTFSKKFIQFPVFIAVITVIMVCGTFIYTEENYQKVYNWYKIPDESKWVIDIISEDDLEKKYVLAVPEVVPYVRQINSNITLVYGRDVTNMYVSWWPQQIKEGNAKAFLPTCKKRGVTYIVLYNNVKLNEEMYKYGYHILAQTYSYDVYKYKE